MSCGDHGLSVEEIVRADLRKLNLEHHGVWTLIYVLLLGVAAYSSSVWVLDSMEFEENVILNISRN